MNMHNRSGTQPPRTDTLAVLTVTTGHTMTSPRSDFSQEGVELLRPIILEGNRFVLMYDVEMTYGWHPGGASFTLRRAGTLLTSGYVAWAHEGAAEMWSTAQAAAEAELGAATTEQPTVLPWLAIVLTPAMSPGTWDPLAGTGHLMRSIAWTIVEGAEDVERQREARLPFPDPFTTMADNHFDHAQDIGADITAFVLGTDNNGIDASGTVGSGVLLPQGGATLSIGSEGLTVYVQLSDPTAAEVADIRRGTLDVGVFSVGGTGVLLTRFGAAADTPRFPAMPPMVLECPYHVGLLPPDRRHLPKRKSGLSLALTIIIQDQYGRQHGARHLGLAIPTAEAIERIVSRQVEEAGRPGWTRTTHDAEVERFYDRNPDIGRAADRLFAKAWARETVQ